MENVGNLKENFAIEVKLDAFYTGGRITLSTDGKRLFCTCGKDLKIVNVENGNTVKTISGKDDQILNFVLSPDDKVLVTSLASGMFQKWDWENDKVIKTWRNTHKGPVSCMTLDSTITLLATGGADSTLKVWDIEGQYITHDFTGCQGVFSVVEFHPNQDRWLLFGCAYDYDIRAWDLMTNRCVAVLKGHMSKVTCLTFTEDGSRMLSSGRDQVVIIWNIQDKMVALKTLPIFEAIESVILIRSPEVLPEIGVNDLHGIKFITAGSMGVLKVWSETGRVLFTQKHGITRPVMADGSVDDGLLIAHAFYNKATDTVAVVTFEQNIVFYKFSNLNLQKQLVGYNDEIVDIVYLGKDDSHFAVATNSTYIKVFEVTTLDCRLLKGHTNTVLSLATFPKKPWMMVSSSKDDSLRIWMLDTDTKDIFCVAVAQGHTRSVGCVACSRSSSKFVVSGSSDTCLKFWTIPTTLSIAANSGNPVALSVKWTGVAHKGDICFVCVSPNDKLVATASHDKVAKVWNAANGSLVGNLEGHRRGVWCVQFSPVDQVVASCAGDGLIKIWSLSDLSCVKTFESQDASVLRILFVSKGMQLMSSSANGLVKLWTVKLSECVKTQDGHEGSVWALTANQGETRIISGGEDSTIIIWKDVTEQLKQEAVQKRAELVQQEQELQNLLQQKKFHKALLYCIRLGQPIRALKVVKELFQLADGREQLEKALNDFRSDQIDALLQFTTNWNTNSKHCYEAQQVLNIILRKFTMEDLLQFPNIQSIVQGLLPYTERHYQRYCHLQQQATFIEYTWQRIKIAQKPELVEKTE